MNSAEFCQNQLDRIDKQLTQVRTDIEALMQLDEYLLEQRERWAGRLATTSCIPSEETFVERKLILIQGGADDANSSA